MGAVLYRPPPSETVPGSDDRSEITDILTVVDDRDISHLFEPDQRMTGIGLALYSIQGASPRTERCAHDAEIISNDKLFCRECTSRARLSVQAAHDKGKDVLVW